MGNPSVSTARRLTQARNELLRRRNALHRPVTTSSHARCPCCLANDEHSVDGSDHPHQVLSAVFVGDEEVEEEEDDDDEADEDANARRTLADDEDEFSTLTIFEVAAREILSRTPDELAEIWGSSSNSPINTTANVQRTSTDEERNHDSTVDSARTWSNNRNARARMGLGYFDNNDDYQTEANYEDLVHEEDDSQWLQLQPTTERIRHPTRHRTRWGSENGTMMIDSLSDELSRPPTRRRRLSYRHNTSEEYNRSLWGPASESISTPLQSNHRNDYHMDIETEQITSPITSSSHTTTNIQQQPHTSHQNERMRRLFRDLQSVALARQAERRQQSREVSGSLLRMTIPVLRRNVSTEVYDSLSTRRPHRTTTTTTANTNISVDDNTNVATLEENWQLLTRSIMRLMRLPRNHLPDISLGPTFSTVADTTTSGSRESVGLLRELNRAVGEAIRNQQELNDSVHSDPDHTSSGNRGSASGSVEQLELLFNRRHSDYEVE